MAYEIYTGYTESDAPGRLSVATNQITITSLDSDEACFIYKDFTSNHFSGDYECRLHFKITVNTSGIVYLWAMTNAVTDPIGTLIAANNDLHCLSWNNATITLTERNSTVSTTDTYSGAINTDYYIRVCRDEATGTYGTLYAYIYSDSNYQDLLDILSVTLTETKDFQYLWAVSGAGNGAGSTALFGAVDHLLVSIHPYTLENIITRIRDFLNEDVPTFWSNTDLTKIINDSVKEIAVQGNCIERIETVTTSVNVRLTAYSAHTIAYAEYIGLTPIGLIEIHPKQVGNVPINGSTPQYYYIENGNIGIEPLPDNTYSIRLYTLDYPSREMSLNTELPELPEEYRPLVVLHALHQAYWKEECIGGASQLLGIVNNAIQYNKFVYDKNRKDSIEDMKIPDKVQVENG